MENEKRKKKKKIAVTIFLLVAATACYSMMSSGSEKDLEIRNAASASEEETETTGESADTEEGNENVQEESGGKEDSEETIPQIYVDVGGAVNTPRVVCIPEGARVFEAIEAAGGVSADAETKYINMAAECADGEKIYVPNQEEMASRTERRRYRGAVRIGDGGADRRQRAGGRWNGQYQYRYLR